jgi:hypothetical protein
VPAQDRDDSRGKHRVDPIHEPIDLGAAVADAYLELCPQRGQATLDLLETQAVDHVGL